MLFEFGEMGFVPSAFAVEYRQANTIRLHKPGINFFIGGTVCSGFSNYRRSRKQKLGGLICREMAFTNCETKSYKLINRK